MPVLASARYILYRPGLRGSYLLFPRYTGWEEDFTHMPDASPSNPPKREVLASTDAWVRRLIISFTFLSWIVLFLIILYLLSYIQVALWVLVIAALIAYAVLPLVTLFHRIMPRFLAILLVYVVIVGVLLFLMYLLITTSIAQIAALAQSIRGYLLPAPHGHISPVAQLLQRSGIPQAQLDQLARSLEAQLGGVASTLARDILPLVSGLLYALSLILFTGVISIYLLADGERFVRWVRRSAPQRVRPGTRRLVQILRDVAGGYVRGEIILCIIIGILVGLGMFVMGVPYPAFLGALAALLEFIPVIGVLISGLLCCLLALTQGWLLAFIVLAYFVGIHIVEGYVLVPRIMGRAIGLHPAITLLAVIAGSEFLGPIGAILAGPLAGLIQSVLFSFWLYYRETHQVQFAETQPESEPQ